MEYELLEKKIRRLVCKLKKHNVDLEVFEHSDIVDYGAVIGKGGEGVVQQCTIKYHGLPVDAAVKTVLDTSDDAIGITLEEIELLCLARDPIVQTTLRVYGVAAIPDKNDSEMGHLAIITEAGLMNALQLYQEHDVPLPVTYDLWAKTAAAIHMMHTKKILHHDIKPENILITGIVRDCSGQIEQVDCKIIDLGMGKRLYTERIVTDDILGTNGYHPPEVLTEEGYDFRADIFSLGVTFCVLLHAPSFLKNKLPVLLKKLHNSKKDGQLGPELFESLLEAAIEKHQTISPAMKHMLCNMLECQEDRTLTLLEVVDRCREEAEKLKEVLNEMPPFLSPCNTCHDSGFSSSVEQSRATESGLLAGVDLSRRSRLSTASSCSSIASSVNRARRRPRRVAARKRPPTRANSTPLVEPLDTIGTRKRKPSENEEYTDCSMESPAPRPLSSLSPRPPLKRTRHT